MFGSLAALPFLLAQAAAPAEAPASLQSQVMQFVPFIPIFLFAYLLLIRPSQQQDKKRREMLGQLKKNDKVLTAAGFYGTVVSVDTDADRVVLRIDEDGKVRVAFARSGIVKIMADGPEKK